MIQPINERDGRFIYFRIREPLTDKASTVCLRDLLQMIEPFLEGAELLTVKSSIPSKREITSGRFSTSDRTTKQHKIAILTVSVSAIPHSPS
jgi:hypothetical protein